MNLSHFKQLGGAALVLLSAPVFFSNPVQAGAILLNSGDNFSFNDNFSGASPELAVPNELGTPPQSYNYSIDPYFSSVYNPLSGCPAPPLLQTSSCASNVDVVGNEPPSTPGLNPFAHLCTANGTADCVDLDGTTVNNPPEGPCVVDGNYVSSGGGVPSYCTNNAQGAVQASVNVTTPGTMVLSSILLGTEGSGGSNDPYRSALSTSVLIVFGNSSCIASTSLAQFEADCQYWDSVTASNPTGVYNVSSLGATIRVSPGTYYIGYFSETPGQQGALLSDSMLVETAAPEPSSMLLLGSALLGLGTVSVVRASTRVRAAV